MADTTRINALINGLVSTWLKYSRKNCEDSYTVSIIKTDVRSLEYTSAGEDKKIFIYVPKRCDILPILHEAGHYIGCRKRDEDRLECLLKMVTFWHIRDIYNHLFNGYMEPGVQEGTIDEAASQNIEKLINPIDDVFINALRNKTKEEIQRIEKDACGERASLSTQLFCASQAVSAMLLDSDGNFFKGLEESKQNRLLEMKSAYYSDGFYTRTKYCQTEVQALVAEPTADSFALRVSGLSFEKYLDKMLTWYYKSTKATSNSRGAALVKELLDQWSTKEPLTRLLTVYYSVQSNGEMTAFKKPRKSIAYFFCAKHRFLHDFKCVFSEQTTRAAEYLKTHNQEELLASTERKIQAVMNPFDIIYSYVNVIYNDPRYDDLCMQLSGKGNRKVPNELCKIVKKIRKLV